MLPEPGSIKCVNSECPGPEWASYLDPRSSEPSQPTRIQASPTLTAFVPPLLTDEAPVLTSDRPD